MQSVFHYALILRWYLAPGFGRVEKITKMIVLPAGFGLNTGMAA
jgi:hypothetical protein